MPSLNWFKLDTDNLINNFDLRDIAEVVYTIREVIDEIRDRPTRQRLAVLPYEIKMMEPNSDAIVKVTEFSKKTGDYATLSATDIKVLALTYQLEVQANGHEHIKSEPQMKKTIVVAPRPPGPKNVETVAGFYMPKVSDTKENDEAETKETDEAEAKETDEAEAKETDESETKELKESETKEPKESETKELKEPETKKLEESKEAEAANISDQMAHLELKEEKQNEEPEISQGNSSEYSDTDPEGEEEQEEEDDEGDDDDSGWITPGNIDHVKKTMNGVVESIQLDVACLTTDFAMQNVLMQMGLHVVSLEGKLIHEARTFILRCYACFRTTTNITKVFCPKCGNQTLKRVAVSLNEDGTLQIHISSRKKITPKGKKFKLPLPRGGKHARNPILVEDQREALQFASRLGRTKTNALDPDYTAGNSPFAMNDIYSRAAQLGRTGRSSKDYWNRRNGSDYIKKKR
nr:EOG090X07WR [Macrothrix elegans]